MAEASRMEKVQTSVRIDADVRQGIEVLRAIEKRPLNRIVNDALAEYLAARANQLKADLSTMQLAVLAYRADPNGPKAELDSLVEAEAGAFPDPAEGRRITPDERSRAKARLLATDEGPQSEGKCPVEKDVLKALRG